MKIGKKEFDLKKNTYIMGILNVTPDSFSDGGQFNTIEMAIRRAKEMVEQGVSIIDVGGESTRPGHEIVDKEEEIRRVVPVIKALSDTLDVPISIDTSKAAVAEAAIKAGAALINDVWGFKKDKKMADIAAKYQVPCCLMHNRDNRKYKNLVEDIIDDLKASIDIAVSAGVKKDNIIIDPGIGFAKSYENNLDVMYHLDKLHELDCPILLGTSRKSMIGLALNLPVEKRLEGTLATTVFGIMKGCSIIRVHDVKENYLVAKMTDIMRVRGENQWIH